jgi:hypothetical protein
MRTRRAVLIALLAVPVMPSPAAGFFRTPLPVLQTGLVYASDGSQQLPADLAVGDRLGHSEDIGCTADASERDHVIRRLGAIYSHEGQAFWVTP